MSRSVARACALVLVVTSIVVASPNPAVGQNVPNAPVEEQGNDIVGSIEAQVDTLQTGSPGSGGPPPSCTWTETLPDGSQVERDDGTPRWRQGHDFWAEGWEEQEGQEVGDGLIYRYECWHPDMGCRTPAPSGNGCLGEAITDTFCGSFLCLFDAVNPPNLALLAVDRFVETLGPPQAAFSPAEQTLVNFDTYMWLTNAPPDEGITPEPLTVPGLTVTASATASEVTWDMGDDTTVTCPVTRDEASAADAPCAHSYEVSSAEQPDERYQGTVSLTYDVRWEASGAGAVSGSIDAHRSGTFTLAVAEAQAINTG